MAGLLQAKRTHKLSIFITGGTVKSTVRVRGWECDKPGIKAVAVMKKALTQASSVQLSNPGLWLRYKPSSKEWNASDPVYGYILMRLTRFIAQAKIWDVARASVA